MPKLNLRNGGICTVVNCINSNRGSGTAHGYCHKHYELWRRHGDPSIKLKPWGKHTICPPHPLRDSYKSMVARCYNSKAKSYHNYGGRGITVYGDWLEDFNNFVNDVGNRPEGTTLDRIDNNGNYEPSNVKWSTPKEQANNSRMNIWVIYDDRKMSITQLRELLGIPHGTIFTWHRKGVLESKIKGVSYV